MLLGGSASGDQANTPAGVSPENLHSLKGCCKASLPVVWHSNCHDWLTPNIFQEWFTGCFCPTVESYHAALLLVTLYTWVASQLMYLLSSCPRIQFQSSP